MRCFLQTAPVDAAQALETTPEQQAEDIEQALAEPRDAKTDKAVAGELF